jgi:hypothetical protein
MNENPGIIFGVVSKGADDPVKGALVHIVRASLPVAGPTGKGKDPALPSATSDNQGRFMIEFAWSGADIAVDEGAPANFHIWAHTEEFPDNWGTGATTSTGSAWFQGFMFFNPKLLNVFPDVTTLSGISSTAKSMVFKFNGVKFPGFRWLPRANRMSTEVWMIVGGGEIYLH